MNNIESRLKRLEETVGVNEESIFTKNYKKWAGENNMFFFISLGVFKEWLKSEIPSKRIATEVAKEIFNSSDLNYIKLLISNYCKY